MTERERLTVLLINSGASFERALPEEIVDYLLANGVLLPPCKLGDSAWYISTENPKTEEAELCVRKEDGVVDGILSTRDGYFICIGDARFVQGCFDKPNEGEMFGFLSAEAAEAALKAREK